MPDIRDRVEQDRGLLKKIQLVIPGYAGYRRREDIRAADNLLRIQLANQLKGVRGDLEDIRDQMAMDGKVQGLQAIGAAVKSMRDAITSFESAWKSRTNAVTGIQVR